MISLRVENFKVTKVTFGTAAEILAELSAGAVEIIKDIALQTEADPEEVLIGFKEVLDECFEVNRE